MRILLVRNQAATGGLEIQFVRMQAGFRALGHECDLHWFHGGPVTARAAPDAPQSIGPLDELLPRIETGGYDAIAAGVDDWRAGAGVLAPLLGARVFAVAAGSVSRYWTARRCTAVIAVSDAVAERQRRRTDAPVVRVHNGIDTELFQRRPQPASSPPIVGWVGRLNDRRKGPDRLAAVAGPLAARGLRLWILSPQGPADVSRELAAALAPHAERWEGLPPDAMPEALSAIAASGGCLLSTSRVEGFGMALAEAQACGCPVIAPERAGGCREVVQPEWGGVLYPERCQGEALAERIASLVRDAAAMARRGDLAVAAMRQRFSFEAMIRGYLDAFASAPEPRRDGWARLVSITPTLGWLARPKRFAGSRLAAVRGLLAAADRLAAAGRADLAEGCRREARALAPWAFLGPVLRRPAR